MHDAAEAYINDLNSPVKHLVEGKYRETEKELERVIAKKWNLCYADGWPKAVVDADTKAFRLETMRLFDPGSPLWLYYKIDPAEYGKSSYRPGELLGPDMAMLAFLGRYKALFEMYLQVPEDSGVSIDG
jgi:hypothetical protein